MNEQEIATVTAEGWATNWANKRRDLAKQNHTNSVMLAELNRRMKKREANLMAVIAGEVDEAGKKKYSNPESRSAELSHRLEADETYIALQEQIDLLSNTLANDQIDERYALDRMEIEKAFAGRV